MKLDIDITKKAPLASGFSPGESVVNRFRVTDVLAGSYDPILRMHSQPEKGRVEAAGVREEEYLYPLENIQFKRDIVVLRRSEEPRRISWAEASGF